AADHPELLRGRLRDLPPAAVLPDDPRGVHRRRARRRLRRAAHPDDRRRPAREARNRRRRALLDPLHLERLLPAAALRRREPGSLDGVDRARAVPEPTSGAVAADAGRDATDHGARDPALLPRAAGVRGRRDADGSEGMKVAVVGAGSTYTPELVSGLSALPVRELTLHDIDAERLEVVGALAGRMLRRVGF